MKNDSQTWILQDTAGTVQTVTTGQIFELAQQGGILSDSRVSRDGKTWISAIEAVSEAFDSLVLTVDGGLNVLGPFSRNFLKRDGAETSIPVNGILYTREDTVKAVQEKGVPPSETGAALVKRVAEAERLARESEKSRRELATQLKTKDLEFEAERQRFSAEGSSLKAEKLRLEEKVSELQAEISRVEAASEKSLKDVARLVDLETMLMEHDATNARKIETLEKEKSALNARAEAAEQNAVETDKRAEAAEKRAAETEQRAEAAELRASEAEKRAAAAEERGQELAARLQTLEKAYRSGTDAWKNIKRSLLEIAEQIPAPEPEDFPLSPAPEPEAAAEVSGGGSAGVVEAEVVSPDDVPIVSGQKEKEVSPQHQRMAFIERQLQKELGRMKAVKKGFSR